MKAAFDYDEEVDILYIYNPEYKGEVLFSVDIDDSVLDVGKGGKIVGVELIDAPAKFSTSREEENIV